MRTYLAATLLLVASASTRRAAPAHAPPLGPGHRIDRPVRVAINDNRLPAGVLRGRLLTLRLVARLGMWYPDGESGTGAAVQAFAEEGHAPLIPGPMIRARAGTEIAITLRNMVPNATLIVHGLTSRGAATPTGRDTAHDAVGDTVQLPEGATRTLRFRLDAPGTYYYWGTTTGRSIVYRTGEDAQLSGAIVVDPAQGRPPADRVLLIGMWSDTTGRALLVRKRLLSVINGRSWPSTERLSYTVGDTVRWRIINASSDSHPMHLHGFFFRVDSRGDGFRDTVYAEEMRDHVVTNLMAPGTTMSLTWSPNRAGNWLFHCHLPEHFGRRGPLGMPPTRATEQAHGEVNHALEGMSGLVMGVTVRPPPGRVAPAAAVASGEPRKLRLVIRSNADGSAASPIFEFALEDGGKSMSTGAGDHRVPTIVLTRGEPVAITVVNTLAEPSAVHWHGIELESYYDGVAGFSGTAHRLSPVIAPGDSFVARFTPPRTGTFIYHTHIDEERQQPAGLAGPLVVLGPGEHYDPVRDLTVVATTPRAPADVIPRTVWLNGGSDPTPLSLQAGLPYRIRFINMTTHTPGLRFELSRDGRLVRWRPVAKDGGDLPIRGQLARDARQPVSIGETVDVEVIPEHPGEQRLEAHAADGALMGTLLVRVSGGGAAKPE